MASPANEQSPSHAGPAAMSESTGLRVLFFLPDLSSYLDRARMLMEVSQGLDRLFLMVGRLDGSLDTSAYHRFTVVDAGFRRGNRVYNLMKANWVARKLVRSRAINVIHDTFGTFFPLFMLRRYVPGVTCCSSFFTLNGWRLSHVWKGVSKLRLLSHRSTAMMYYGLWLEHIMCRYADRVILQAPDLVDRLREYVDLPACRVNVLANSVDTDYWRPSESSVPSNDAGDGKVRMLFVGTIDRSRGALVLIEALHALNQRGIPTTLTMIGAWERTTRAPALELVERHGIADKVHFAGRMPRAGLIAQFRSHDLFLYQTTNDASPRVVLEAMASGIPVIASQHPGIDVIDPQGVSIAFTNYGDTGHIADLVGSFVSDRSEWRERAEAGRQIAVQRFASKAVARQYLTLYRSMAAA